nr:RagB/SusD family nutrient uptake outer membrane protein [Cytophagales bacterium]
MKNLHITSYIYKLLFSCVIITMSCDENAFLEEVPLDFFSPENSFVTFEDYQSAIADLYSRVRRMQSLDMNATYECDFLGTDIAHNARLDATRIGDYDASITPQAEIVRYHWINWYKVVSNANTIISRIPDSNLNVSEKDAVTAEAKLFRAWAYRFLAHLYGDVPLQLEEIITPKFDFIRNSKETVLRQIVQDCKEAVINLPTLDQALNGKLTKPVAYHLLAETYIALGEYENAVEAANEVIDNSGLALMRERFGSLRNQPGDVYWDLFRVNNQNRSQGNTEGIWVIQYELDVLGGALESSGGEGDSRLNRLERCIGPASWSLRTPDELSATPNGLGASTLNGGGRGVGFIMPTDYYLYGIWGLNPEDDNRIIVNNPDIRTSEINIVRDFKYTNPKSEYFGLSLIDHPGLNWRPGQFFRWYPFPSKITTPGQHPEGLIENASDLTLRATAGATYRDVYYIRLPETILLRAEAYVKMGDVTSAAADVNLIRSRANARLAAPEEMDIDYILDERARELAFEESRRITLARMDLLVERVRKYNPRNGPQIQEYHRVFPVPFSEIEANKDAELGQNPGYN